MASDLILELPTCGLRPFRYTDAEAMDEQGKNPSIWRWEPNRFPYSKTLDETRGWISFCRSASPVLNFAMCKPDDASVFIGSINLKLGEDIYSRTMTVGYWVAEEYWGQGIASNAIAGISDWVFRNFDHVLRLEAEVHDGNKPSCRVLEKAGFVLEGRRRSAIEKAGVVKDSLLYGKLRDQ